MLIEFSWWVIPFTITIGSIVYMVTAPADSGLGGDISSLITGLALIILILASWLIWALLT